MNHNYTDAELQAAIDVAFPQGRTEDIHRLTLSPSSLYWKEETPARLQLIKSAIAALPEPVDEASMLLNLLAIIHRDGGQYQAEHGTRKAVEDAHKEWARLISIVEETEPKQSLSQLRPIAEAGAVPEGCVRATGYKSQHSKTGWVVADLMYHGVTHFADIRLPEPTPEPLEIKPWNPAVGDVVTLKSGGPKMTVSLIKGTVCECQWFRADEADVETFEIATIQPA